MNPETLEILQLMQIPVWLPKKVAQTLQSVPPILSIPSIEARYLLLVGLMGEWDAQDSFIKESKFNMLKRLIMALNWDFESCLIAEFNVETQAVFLNAIEQSRVEKIIVFGNALNISSEKMIMVPSIEDLMTQPIKKREAWGLLLPHKIL